MFIINALLPFSPLLETLIDSTLLILVISPFLYILFFRPLTRNLAERVCAEKALKKANDELERRVEERTTDLALVNERLNKFFRAVEQSTVSIVITDTDGNIEYVNPKFTQVSGYAFEEVIEQNPRILKSEDTPSEEYKMLWETITSGMEWQGEFHNKKKNGELFWESATICPIRNTNGEITNFLAVKKDITKQKQAEDALRESEEKYRNIINTSREGFNALNTKLEIVQVNDAFCEMLGFEPEELMEKKPIELVHEDSLRVIKEQLSKIPTTPYRNYEAVLKAKDSSEVHVIINATTTRNASGEVTGTFAFFTDITKWKKVEEEAIKAQRLKSIGIFAGGVAHDFKNFLVGALGQISMAKRKTNPSEAVYKKLERIEKACVQAESLSEQLLNFSKGAALIKKKISIEVLLKDSVLFVLGNSNVRPEFSIPEDLWPLEVDEGQMSQVIINLMMNSIQAMPQGGTVLVRAENSAIAEDQAIPLPEGRYVKISIQDNGPGIPREHIQNVFDPYFTTKDKGSGLGLATSYSIVKKHDGLIEAESESGVGTTFTIYLPASVKRPCP